MKSIEEKAKAYDEALKVATKYKDTHIMFPSIKDEMFPELKESEDERIRKEIIAWLKSKDGQTLPMDRYNAAVAWLEKQGEQRHVEYDEEDSKLECREWVEKYYPEQSFEIKDMIGHGYLAGRVNAFMDAEQEAKEKYKIEWSEEDYKIIDGLIKKILENYNGCSIINGISEDRVIDWLKSLKDRVQLQPKQEWSENDEVAVKDICDKLNRLSMSYVGNESIICQEEIKWLKSLRPQNRWKPSEEQMNGLKEAIEFLGCTKARREQLQSLYEQLKKLREE